MNFCPNCGNELTEQGRFCTKCGADLAPQPAPMPQQPPKSNTGKVLAIVLPISIVLVVAIIVGGILGYKAIQTKKYSGYNNSYSYNNNNSSSSSSSSSYSITRSQAITKAQTYVKNNPANIKNSSAYRNGDYTVKYVNISSAKVMAENDTCYHVTVYGYASFYDKYGNYYKRVNIEDSVKVYKNSGLVTQSSITYHY